MLKDVAAAVVAAGGGEGAGVLIVDDLVDTGQTAKVVRALLPRAHFATVYAKPMGRPLVDTFITEVSQDTWIYFPWDTGLAFQPPIREAGLVVRDPRIGYNAAKPDNRGGRHGRRHAQSQSTTPPTRIRTSCARPQMEWKKTRFAGCEVKGLLFDKETGLVTALMKFAPGATLPDHEHVKIEQTYVLEGKLVDKEGPAKGFTVGPGEFVWREAGSRHVAWTPEGGLMLAMFQVPNKFFEKDGRVTDISGADWDDLWGHVFKE